jgi:hypothetical protein
MGRSVLGNKGEESAPGCMKNNAHRAWNGGRSAQGDIVRAQHWFIEKLADDVYRGS